jgi:hypothetical protein
VKVPTMSAEALAELEAKDQVMERLRSVIAELKVYPALLRTSLLTNHSMSKRQIL